MTVIRHATIFTADAVIPDGTLRIIDERIALIGVHGPDHTDDWTTAVVPGETEIDARGLLLIPGLIDLQCNGIAGYDALYGGRDAVVAIAATLPRYGCTAVLPTLVTAPPSDLLAAVRCVARAREMAIGAQILGSHLEGPWINPSFHGAHPEAQVRQFDRAEFAALAEAAENTIRLVTLAPEMPGGLDAVSDLASRGVVVSLGHSGASYEAATAAVLRGAHKATHLFNAMGALHHRKPGLAGAALTLPGLTPGIIPDGHHVHPAMLRLAMSARGPAGVLIVTDSVPSAGLPPGMYRWLDRPVTWDGETVTLPDGGLAGSGLTPIEALRRLIRYTGLSLADALPSMTSTPARVVGEEGNRGVIAPGYRADLVLLTPDLDVHTTFVGGKTVYRA